MEEEEDFYLCCDCSKDIYLKKYVHENYIDNGNLCTICQTETLTLDINENPKLRKFCRFLIRYHFPEYIYNSKWGGEDFPAPFLEENSIINHEFKNYKSREDSVQFFIQNLFDLNSYPFHDLYYGYDEHGKSLFGSSIKNDGSYYWKYYKRELEKTNHYLLKDKAFKTFKNIFENHKYILERDILFYRARIGFKEVTEETDIIPVKLKAPFRNGEISAPPIFKATAGRLNRQGVSYLYLGSNENVAIGEVRPHPGHYVSVGCFKSNSKLKIADLRFFNLYEYFDDKEKLKIFLFLRDISNELSLPVVPDEQEHYLITQFISDTVRDLGYDGIMFNSSVSSGYNLLVFDSAKFEYIEDNSNLLKIKGMDYEVGKIIHEPDRFTGMPEEEITAYNNVYSK